MKLRDKGFYPYQINLIAYNTSSMRRRPFLVLLYCEKTKKQSLLFSALIPSLITIFTDKLSENNKSILKD